MKKLFSLLAIFVMALSLNAQSNADLLQGQTYQMMQTMQREGVPEMTIAVGGQSANGPAVSPRNPSPPASAHRPAANNAAGSAKAKTTKINGVEVFITPYGLHLPGDMFPDPNTGEELIVDDYGNVLKTGKMWKQTPVPNPNNNTGTATASLTVMPTIGDLYDTLPGGRIVAIGDVRVIDPAGSTAQAGSGTTSTGGGSKFQKMQIAPNEILFNEETGEVALLDRRRERLRTNRGYGVGTNPEEDHQPNTWPNAMAARFSSIDGSGSAMSGGAMFGGGVAYGQTVVYNQRPRAVATYGVRGGDCWRPQWRR
jgi:hypothetical protein